MPSNGYTNRRTKTPHSCQYCGDDFYPRIDQLKAGIGKFCSRKCSGAARRIPLKERFWSNVEKFDEGCWEWTAAKNNEGYGLTSHNGQLQLTHRLSWEMHYGPVPDGLFVCHHCDNPLCVRPEHLFTGTNGDNMKDMYKKGRRKQSHGKSSEKPMIPSASSRRIT